MRLFWFAIAPPFQFTPLREGRRPPAQLHQGGQNISIHAPPRGATQHRELVSLWDKFQFTPLREGRRFALCAAV